MSARAQWKALVWSGALAALGLVVLGVVLGRDEPSEPVVTPAVVAAPAPAAAPAPPVPSSAPAQPSGAAPAELAALDKLLQVPETAAPEEPPAEYPVNMEQLRERLPDNLYWKLDAPTKDPQVLQQRAEAQRRWNELFGKVQAGEASEEEIHRYYDHRRQLSEDYIAFASLMLTEYGQRLPERDQGLLTLSIQMHRTRLQELPRQVEDALSRKQQQEQRREEWRRGGKSP